MVKESFVEILNHPEKIEGKIANNLNDIVNQYPYFQSARALYLKALKNDESFKYNNELKKAAAYTTDRTVLFDFITSEVFNTKTSESTESKKETSVAKESLNIKEQVESDLEIGKPLSFTRNETFSFNQWLQLSGDTPPEKEVKDAAATEEKPKDDSKSLQDNIIDRFITNNPKISRIDKHATVKSKQKQSEQDILPMTETLAKIYLEQKKYDNAVKAYEILSLKYPEKSGFFADQIKKIRILQKL